jgi:two-component system, LytTR family, response regulator
MSIKPTFKALIIDDAPKVRESLMMIIEKFCPELELIGASSNFSEGYSMITDLDPDIVFLDIQLNSSEGTGLDLAVLTRAGFKGAFIFISGFRQYAVDAFRIHAADYLLKPLDVQEVMEAVEKAIAHVGPARQQTITSVFHLPNVYGFLLVNQDDIIRLQAEGAYTQLILQGAEGKKTCSMHLGEVEKKLNGNLFFRVHKSHIIQKRFITGYQRGDGGIALMADGTEIPVSRAAKESFLAWLG